MNKIGNSEGVDFEINDNGTTQGTGYSSKKQFLTSDNIKTLRKDGVHDITLLAVRKGIRGAIPDEIFDLFRFYRPEVSREIIDYANAQLKEDRNPADDTWEGQDL